MSTLEKKKTKKKEQVEKDRSILDEIEKTIGDLKKDTSSKPKTSSPSLKPKTAVPPTQPVTPIISPPLMEPDIPPPVVKPPISKKPVKKISPEVREILPPWIEKPWRYITPNEEEMRLKWLASWGDFVMDFAEATEEPMLKIRDIKNEFPFKNPIIKKSLSLEQLQDIGDDLEKREHAKWWDKNKRKLRLYWMTLSEVSDEIYDWAIDRGMLDLAVFDLKEAKQPWSKIPSNELYAVLIILVDSKNADWANKEKDAIRLRYE
jgi:hypothetical protein